MLLSFSSIGPRAVSSRQEIELIQRGPTSPESILPVPEDDFQRVRRQI